MTAAILDLHVLRLYMFMVLAVLVTGQKIDVRPGVAFALNNRTSRG